MEKNNKIIMTLAFMLCSYVVMSQEVNYFEVNDSLVYEITGCNPYSDLTFYTQKGGGDLMKAVTTTGAGSITFSESTNFLPNAILNSIRENSNGIAGTGKLNYLPEKEFTFNNESVVNIDGSISLSWNAAVTQGDMHSFEIMKSNDSVNYTVIGTVYATDTSSEINPYVFLDDDVIEGSLYEIRVVSAAKGTRYTTQPMAIAGSAARGVSSANTQNTATDALVKIYPTTTHDVFNIILNQSGMNAPYKILNEQGQTIIAGKLNKQENAISLGSFAAGNYFIVVQTGKLKTTGRVVKY